MRSFLLLVAAITVGKICVSQPEKLSFTAPSEAYYMNGIFDLGADGYLMTFVDVSASFKNQGNLHIKYISGENKTVWEKDLLRDDLGGGYEMKTLRIKRNNDCIYLLNINTLTGAGNKGYFMVTQLELKTGALQKKRLEDHEQYKRIFAVEVTNENLVYMQWVDRGAEEKDEYYINLLSPKTLSGTVKNKISFPPTPANAGWHFDMWIYCGTHGGNYYFYKKFSKRDNALITDPWYQVVAVSAEGKVISDTKIAPTLSAGKYFHDGGSPHINQGYFFGFEDLDVTETASGSKAGIGKLGDIYLDEQSGEFYVSGLYGITPFAITRSEEKAGFFIIKFDQKGEKKWAKEIATADPGWNYNLRIDRKTNNIQLLSKDFVENSEWGSKAYKTSMLVLSGDGELISNCAGQQPKEMYTPKMKKQIVIYYNEDDQIRYLPGPLVKACKEITEWGDGYVKAAELSQKVAAGKEAYYFVKPMDDDKDMVIEYLWTDKVINSYVTGN